MLRMPKVRRVFQGAHEPGEEERTEGGADDDPDAVCIGDGVGLFFPEVQEIAETEEETQGFEEQVGAQGCTTQMQLEREGHGIKVGEMGERRDFNKFSCGKDFVFFRFCLLGKFVSTVRYFFRAAAFHEYFTGNRCL